MAVTIRRADPLKGVADAKTIRTVIALMHDKTQNDRDRQEAAGWLRGIIKVMVARPKQQTAVDYIVSELNRFSTGGHDV